jgi:spermidine synthase
VPRQLSKIAPLLFASGACSLIYETVWLRELRLVFGGSTMASATVVACFVGGLGAGGLVFGRRADRKASPLSMYAALEAGIATSAAVTPLLLYFVRAAYIGVGGTRVLGAAAGTGLRLLLAALVFAAPTLLMGGTLPAVARAVEHDDDRGRRDVAVLYGVNTLGAVTGCMLSTFVLFEIFGTRLTLWIASLINLLVAVIARSLARSLPELGPRDTSASPAPSPETPELSPTPTWFTLSAAGVTGFVFCLMELVWYRMLGPLLGGSVFTFGIILAVALLGIGIGSLAYGLRPRGVTATLHGFAWTCVLGAVCVALPYALGDRLAVLAVMLRPMGDLSFGLRVAGWILVAGTVILPAALVSGVQFTLLIGLLGRGRRDVARDVGRVYATNTIGAIVGSLAGGFGLIPALTAPGCWRFVVWVSIALGIVATLLDARRRSFYALGPVLPAIVASLLLRAEGPTAAWRHSPIGAGRVEASVLRSPNEVVAWEHERRRAIVWQVDGRESSVALDGGNGLAFIVNGKVDGSVRADAGTAVMAGIVGAMLHPHPTRAMVIGLGTGETAGWLAAIDTVTDVDVAELEPSILEVARRSAAANHDALDNPKVHVEIGDARELLLTSSRRYSVVMSEPSNPYRAGVASLFTQSYYQVIRDRLDEDGLFLQWLQGYEVDARTVRTVYATLGSVFPEVETWELDNEDLLLVASKRPIEHDLDRMQGRLREEPYRSASGLAWRATSLEGFLAHFVATSGLARKVAEEDHDRVNTDDLNIVEFGFARTIGSGLANFAIEDIERVARARGESRPALAGGNVDWDRVDEERVAFDVAEERVRTPPSGGSPERAHRLAAMRAFDSGNASLVTSEWSAQPEEPRGPIPTALLAMALADIGDEAALRYVEPLRSFEPAEADAVVAHLRTRQGRLEEATAAIEATFTRLRVDPWPLSRMLKPVFDDAPQIALRDARLAPRLYAALREPFVLALFDARRTQTAFKISMSMVGPACVAALSVLEPNFPWNADFLLTRYRCLHTRNDPGAANAEKDWLAFMADAPSKFATGLTP